MIVPLSAHVKKAFGAIMRYSCASRKEGDCQSFDRQHKNARPNLAELPCIGEPKRIEECWQAVVYKTDRTLKVHQIKFTKSSPDE